MEITSSASEAVPPAVAAEAVLSARDVEVRLPDGRKILGPVSLDVRPGTFTAVLGASGSGKTTLLRAMAGLTEPTQGSVEFGDDAAARHVDELGYVPQRETVHGRLTVEEALRYAAVLRLTDDADVDLVVRDVLEVLDLTEQASTRIRDLSGGERRRAACGTELVGQPRVLLLDEPTSGLDPVLERRLMLLFRRLADQGTAVIVISHATASLDLCDVVAVLEPGGSVAVIGGAQDARSHFDTVARRAEPGQEDHPAASRRPHVAHSGGRSIAVELGVLMARYARTLTRDRRTLAALLGQAPVIGFLIAVLFGSGAFAADERTPSDVVQLAFLLMTGAIWLGVTSSCREVVKERSIIEREFDVGLRLDAYIFAKAGVLFVLTAVQVVLMLVAVVVVQPLGIGLGGVLTVAAVTIAVAWTSVAVGLVVSVLARSADQAASVVPLVLIPQLLFAGCLVPLERMPSIIQGVANITYARWAYAGIGSGLDVDRRLNAASDIAATLGYGTSFFALAPSVSVAVLLGFTIGLLLIAMLLLGRRTVTDD